MTKTNLGLLLIGVGTLYGLTAWDKFNALTIGKLMQHGFIKQPTTEEAKPDKFGHKGTILLYSFTLIGLGLYLVLTPDF